MAVLRSQRGCLIEHKGSISIFGHIMQVNWGGEKPDAVWLTVGDSGGWRLQSGKSTVSSGNVSFPANVWHNLRLLFNGNVLSAFIDGNKVAEITETAYPFGLVGFGSGWNNAQFASFSIDYNPIPKDLALHQRAIASGQWSDDYAARCAVDGNPGTRWNSANGSAAGEWLEVDFGKATRFNRVIISQFYLRILKYKIQYWVGDHWEDVWTGGPMRNVEVIAFPTVKSERVRLLVEKTQNGITPSIYELQVYDIQGRRRCDDGSTLTP